MSVFDRLKIFDAFTNAGLPEQAGRDLSDVLEEGAEALAKQTDVDRMLDRVHRMFAEHETRMVNQMSKMMLAHTGFVVAVSGWLWRSSSSSSTSDAVGGRNYRSLPISRPR